MLAILPSLMAASDQGNCDEVKYHHDHQLTDIIAGHGPLEVVGVLGHELLDDVHLLHEQLYGVAELGVTGDVG